jgi:hypothetical protein
LIELGDQVGRVIRTHLGQHGSSLRIRLVAEKFHLVLGVELFKDVCFQLRVPVHGRDDLLALVMRRGFDEVGDLRGVQTAQTPQGHEQP